MGYCQGFNVLAALILGVVDWQENDALKVRLSGCGVMWLQLKGCVVVWHCCFVAVCLCGRVATWCRGFAGDDLRDRQGAAGELLRQQPEVFVGRHGGAEGPAKDPLAQALQAP